MISIFNPFGPDANPDVPSGSMEGEGEMLIEIRSPSASVDISYKEDSLIIKPSVSSEVSVRGLGDVSFTGNASYDTIQDKLSAGIALGFALSKNATVSISEKYSSGSYTTTVGIKVNF